MSVVVKKVRFQFRRALAADWVFENPLLRNAEPAYEEDTGKWKLGDGVTLYNDLPYQGLGEEAAVSHQELDAHVQSDDPHPVYDDGRSLVLLYQNAKV